METTHNLQLIPIHIMGKRYEVPFGLTIMQGIEYAGYYLTRGCGCRGGVCGACVTIYREKDEYQWQFGLACQTVVKENMYLVQLPYVPARKAIYNVDTTELSEKQVVALYPELLRCMGCNTCTRSCPMDISVMNYVSDALQGNWDAVKEHSIECVMCGMCAAKCPAGLSPFNIALLVRRMLGSRIFKTTSSVERRLKDIKDGVYQSELDKVKAMDKEDLHKLYKDYQLTKGKAV